MTDAREPTTTPERAIKCLYCERKFRSVQDLKNHVRIKRRTSAKHGLDGQIIRTRSRIVADLAREFANAKRHTRNYRAADKN